MNRLDQFRSWSECVRRILRDPRVAGAVALVPQFCQAHGRGVRVVATWNDNSQKTFAVHPLADGTSSVEREFLADLLMPDGQTVHEAIAQRIEQAYLDGEVRPLLPARGETS